MENYTSELLKNDFKRILDYSSALSFSFFDDSKKKKERISREKNYIDEIIDSILEVNNLPKDAITNIRYELWTASESEAQDKFTNLPQKLQLNSFYLQELIYTYAEKQINEIKKILN